MNPDFIIVGAGVYGAATAWWLAQRGASAIVLDSRDIATRASGGPGRRGVRANARDKAELPLMRHAYELWPQLHEVLDAEPFYERTGHLLLGETDEDIARLKAHTQLQNAFGIKTHMVAGTELETLEPQLSPSVKAAAYCADDGVANHSATTRAYAAAAQRLGVEVRTFTQVVNILVNADRAVGVETDTGEQIHAERGVLVLSNSTVATLLSPWVRLPIWNGCFQVLVTQPLKTQPVRHLIGHVRRTISIKSEGTDRLMLSGGWRGVWDAERQEGEPLQDQIDGNVREAFSLYPSLKDLAVDIADTSHQESVTVDALPIIDQPKGLSNLWYGTGWCGHGWAIAPVIAEHLASWALGAGRPPLLAPFNAARFEA